MYADDRGQIHVRWRGLFGNRLFQLAGGIVLAMESQCQVRAKPLSGLPLAQFQPPCEPEGCFRTSSVHPEFHCDEWAQRLRNGEHIVVDGHHQQYRHYRDHKVVIKTLLQFHHTASFIPSANDLVVHMRLQGQYAQWPYDLKALRQNIEKWRGGRVIFVTDEPDHSFFDEMLPDSIVISGTLEGDFATLIRANRLVITPGTFGWWAAWLGHAEQVYFPERQGIWKKPYIDLFVDDESRYIKY